MSDRNRILCEFRNKTKSIMGDSLKQMIYMVHMQEEIMEIIQIWI